MKFVTDKLKSADHKALLAELFMKLQANTPTGRLKEFSPQYGAANKWKRISKRIGALHPDDSQHMIGSLNPGDVQRMVVREFRCADLPGVATMYERLRPDGMYEITAELKGFPDVVLTACDHASLSKPPAKEKPADDTPKPEQYGVWS